MFVSLLFLGVYSRNIRNFWEKKNDVLVIFIFTVRVFVRLFWHHQSRQGSVLVVLESEINVHSYKHYTILFRLKVREKISDTVKICLTFYLRYVFVTSCWICIFVPGTHKVFTNSAAALFKCTFNAVFISVALLIVSYDLQKIERREFAAHVNSRNNWRTWWNQLRGTWSAEN